jgi:hypothetical protein
LLKVLPLVLVNRQWDRSIFSFTASVAILFGSIDHDKLLLSSSSEQSLRLVGTNFGLDTKRVRFLSFTVERGFVGVGLVALGTIVGSWFK